jgi:hypothetical protein
MSGTESMVVWSVVVVFGLFAAVLAWADNYTREVREHRH